VPITVCHPVAAIPFRRIGLVFSALTIGSMTPDFEFFLRLSDGKAAGHTLPGIFLFDVPVGIIALVLYHLLLKFPLLSLLSHSVQSRLYSSASKFKFFPISRFCLIVLSLVIGAGTHLFLDAFTHADGWFVQHISLLYTPLIATSHGIVRVYFALQYAGSFFAAVLMLYWFLKWYYNENPITHIVLHRFHVRRRTWIVLSIILFSLSCGLIYGIESAHGLHSDVMLKKFITHTTIATISSSMIALVTFGIAWHFCIPNHKRKTHLPAAQEKIFSEQLPIGSKVQ
jgi:hypothetical protein